MMSPDQTLGILSRQCRVGAFLCPRCCDPCPRGHKMVPTLLGFFTLVVLLAFV